MIQIKSFHNEGEANQFLKSIAPEAIHEIKPFMSGLMVTYETDRQYHQRQIDDEESRRIMDLIVHQADRAWDDIDEEAGSRSLEVTISMLINQTLAYYIPKDHPLNNARSTIMSPQIDTTITSDILNQIPNADGWRLYEVKLNTSPYDQACYGYVLAGYYINDPQYESATTQLRFLDNNFQAHGNNFILDAETVTQWRLLWLPDD